MSTCLDDRMHPCLHTLIIKCPHACVLLCSQVLTCLACHMCKWKIVFSHAHSWMLTCLIAHMLRMPTCLNAYILLGVLTLMITCCQAHMPCWSYATMLHVLMITCSYAHIHWYSHVSYPYTCAHTWLMICLYSWRLKWSCSYTFVRSNALTIVLEC